MIRTQQHQQLLGGGIKTASRTIPSIFLRRRLVPSLLLLLLLHVALSTPVIVESFAPAAHHHHITSSRRRKTILQTRRKRILSSQLQRRRNNRPFVVNNEFDPRSCLWPLYFSSSSDDNKAADTDGDDERSSNPQLIRRKAIMGTIATLGAIETAYLTYTKLAGIEINNNICSIIGSSGMSNSCGSVLNGPYSFIPIGEIHIPIAALGFLAYAAVALLAFNNNKVDADVNVEDRNNNNVYLTAISTAMGVFSIFLMTLLFGVLKEMCVFCVVSAIFSISLMTLAWSDDGALPKDSKRDGALASIGTSLVATAAAVVLFLSNSNDVAQQPPMTLLASTSSSSSTTSTLVGSTKEEEDTGQKPPSITTTSTKREIELATKLQALDTHFYGAFWCSHCYEQKQELGRQAMSKIPYVECSKDGYNSQAPLCRSKKVPGYPTWEINGKLYPGEQALEELEEIVMAENTK